MLIVPLYTLSMFSSATSILKIYLLLTDGNSFLFVAWQTSLFFCPAAEYTQNVKSDVSVFKHVLS